MKYTKQIFSLLCLCLILFIQHFIRPNSIYIPFSDFLPNFFTALCLPYLLKILSANNKIFYYYLLSFLILLFHEIQLYYSYEINKFDIIDIVFSVFGLALNFFLDKNLLHQIQTKSVKSKITFKKD
jgi:hypothetical protein